MAFSIFLRSNVSRICTQQAMKMATRPCISRPVSLPITSLLPKEIKTSTPIINAVRSLKTSPVHMAAGSDHSKIWVMERLLSVALVPIIPVALLYPSKIMDSVLAVALVAHIFWGVEAIAVDYVREILFGKMIPKLAIASVYAICIVTLGGLFYLIYNDIGLANTIIKFWRIGTEKQC